MKMTKFLIALAAFSSLASGAYAVDVVGNASATVAAPLTVTEDPAEQLSFGTFVPPSAGEGHVITTSLTTSDAVDVTEIAEGGNGKFDVVGQAGSTVNIAVTTPAVMTRQGGAETLTASVGSNPTLNLPSGTGSFEVLGNLLVPAGTVAGNYIGTYNLTVSY